MQVGRKKGTTKTGGRKKGTPNRTTTALKEMILEAAELAGNDIGEGGGTVQYLRMQATLNPGPFMTLLGKVLPTQLTGDPENPIQTVTRIERAIIDPREDVADRDAEGVPTSH